MSARVEQARAALAEAEAATKAADEAHQAAKKAWGDARKELNAALIDADKDLPRVVVHSRGSAKIWPSVIWIIVLNEVTMIT